MATVLRSMDNKNKPLCIGDGNPLKRTYFNLVRLNKGESWSTRLDRFESVYVVLSGTVSLKVGGRSFDQVGGRDSVWSGMADSVYVPVGQEVRLGCESASTEVAVAGAECSETFEPFRIQPSEVEIVEVGSRELHCRRRICHILGRNAEGRAGRLLISELYCDSGSWSGYPPHKHDTDNGAEETDSEELYHYRFKPENGFGVQVRFLDNGESSCWMTRNGDTFLLDTGYHPTVTSPGHEEYIFTVLVGASRRSLIQNFKEEYRYLMNSIPGIANMRERFK